MELDGPNSALGCVGHPDDNGAPAKPCVAQPTARKSRTLMIRSDMPRPPCTRKDE
jgi:hypothetical protein